MSKRLLIGAALLCCVATAAPATPMMSLSRTDRTFLPQAAMGNTFEIKAAQIAERKAAGRGVHTFAARMIRDHTALGTNVMAAVHRVSPAMMLPMGVSAAQQRMLDALTRAGRNFDALYRADMVQSHAQTYALFQTYARSRYASAGIRQVIRGALPTVKMHWTMAEGLPRM